ncbi:hypothetical protein [Cohnella soli]|uniref:Histidine kinase N-terminal 7TM region domain-containing protein n=1 Tax=Cohnella soli TaxID=425005 RepID=A0ABW0HLE7_9BACL
MLTLQLGYFGLILWFGLYMMNRDARNLRLLLAGISVLVSAFCVGTALLLTYSQHAETIVFLGNVRDICFYLPLVLWQGAILSPAVGEEEKRNILWKLWKYALAALTIGSVIWLVLARNSDGYDMFYSLVTGMITLLLTALSIWDSVVTGRQKRSLSYIVCSYVPLLVFACLTALIIFLPEGTWEKGKLIVNSAGLILFGAYTMIKEIRKQGESWLPDLFRSLDYSIFFTLIFSGQVALVIWLGKGLDFTSLLLLMISIAVSISFQVFVYPIRAFLDNIAFMTFPKLRTERSKLRIAESVQVRIDTDAKPEEMNEEELYRHIRRALSNLGNLERLASSPLVQLKLIEERIHRRKTGNGIVERANELKFLLIDTIIEMKPRGDKPFGTTDEWKFYNALYFPYVVGIKPYSVRYSDEQLDTPSKEALDWFRTYVPERTCYNWQNAGARLIASSLREKNDLAQAQ